MDFFLIKCSTNYSLLQLTFIANLVVMCYAREVVNIGLPNKLLDSSTP